MSTPPATDKDLIRFSIDWKIKRAKFDGITKTSSIGKDFVTPFEHVVLRWQASLHVSDKEQDKMRFAIKYVHGPTEKFDGMIYAVDIINRDRSSRLYKFSPRCDATRGGSRSWPNFPDKESKKVWEAYGLSDDDLFVCRITLSIPPAVFTWNDHISLPTAHKWMADSFEVIEDPEKSIFWNAKLISRDGKVFYCHKNISFQSKPLQAMFRHPPAEGKPEDEYEFPGLASESLRALLQYLYTGQAKMTDLSMDKVIEMADIAEQYDLKPLKEACATELGNRVVKSPEICYSIIQFSDLHVDMNCLKDRAMDVLAEKYGELMAYTKNLAQEFGGGERGEKLRQEFELFRFRRLQPC